MAHGASAQPEPSARRFRPELAAAYTAWAAQRHHSDAEFDRVHDVVSEYANHPERAVPADPMEGAAWLERCRPVEAFSRIRQTTRLKDRLALWCADRMAAVDQGGRPLLEGAEAAAQLGAAIGALPLRHRIALMERDWKGTSTAEIARRLFGSPAVPARQRVNRLVRSARAQLLVDLSARTDHWAPLDILLADPAALYHELHKLDLSDREKL